MHSVGIGPRQEKEYGERCSAPCLVSGSARVRGVGPVARPNSVQALVAQQLFNRAGAGTS